MSDESISCPNCGTELTDIENIILGCTNCQLTLMKSDPHCDLKIKDRMNQLQKIYRSYERKNYNPY